MEAAISLGAREHHLLNAAHRAGSLTPDISNSLDDALNDLVRRGQQTGRVRADLVTDDLPRLIAMLYSVLSTMDSDQRWLATLRRPDSRRDIDLRKTTTASRAGSALFRTQQLAHLSRPD